MTISTDLYLYRFLLLFFSEMETTSTCPICKNEISSSCNTATLRQKGANSINAACQRRNDCLLVKSGQFVHTECRRDYCDESRIQAHLSSKSKVEPQIQVETRTTRSEGTFNFVSDCLFCGEEVKTHNKAAKNFPVRTGSHFQDTIRKRCLQRNDAVGRIVLGRLEFAGDLPAKEAVYHQTCSVNFRNFNKLLESHSCDHTPNK